MGIWLKLVKEFKKKKQNNVWHFNFKKCANKSLLILSNELHGYIEWLRPSWCRTFDNILGCLNCFKFLENAYIFLNYCSQERKWHAESLYQLKFLFNSISYWISKLHQTNISSQQGHFFSLSFNSSLQKYSEEWGLMATWTVQTCRINDKYIVFFYTTFFHICWVVILIHYNKMFTLWT